MIQSINAEFVLTLHIHPPCFSSHNIGISTSLINKLCTILDCPAENILRFVPDEDHTKSDCRSIPEQQSLFVNTLCNFQCFCQFQTERIAAGLSMVVQKQNAVLFTVRIRTHILLKIGQFSAKLIALFFRT